MRAPTARPCPLYAKAAKHARNAQVSTERATASTTCSCTRTCPLERAERFVRLRVRVSSRAFICICALSHTLTHTRTHLRLTCPRPLCWRIQQLEHVLVSVGTLIELTRYTCETGSPVPRPLIIAGDAICSTFMSVMLWSQLARTFNQQHPCNGIKFHEPSV